MKNKKFDLYEVIVKKTIKLNQSKRTDLRISVMMSLKIALFCIWYLAIDDDSKYTGIAIAINIITWPIYHFFIAIIELQYMYDEDLPDGIRNSFYKFSDQLQNFILLIEFCVLVFGQEYHSAFHIVILTFLILDFVLFIATLIYNLIIGFMKDLEHIKYLDSLPQNTQQLADQMSSQIVVEIQQQKNEQLPDLEYINRAQEKIKQIQQQHFAQNIASHINLELYSRGMQKGNIMCQISVNEDQILVFEPIQTQQQIYEPPLQSQISDTSSSANENNKSYTLGIFEIAFFIAALIANIIFIIIFTRANVENTTLKWIGILEIAGNFLSNFCSIYLYLKHGKGQETIFLGLSNCTFTKIISTILQGFVCGITSLFYGVIFGIILVATIIIFCVMICSEDQKKKEKPKKNHTGKLIAFWMAGALFGRVF